MGTGLLVFEGVLHSRLTEKVLLQNENGEWDLISLSTNFREGLASFPFPGLNHPLLAVIGQRERCWPDSGMASPPQAHGPRRVRSHLGRSPARCHGRWLPGLSRLPGARGQHRDRDSEKPSGPTSPTSLAAAGSSQTYSFPTAYASRRGDVTGRRSTRSTRGRCALAQAPPPASGGRRPVPPCPERRASAHGQPPCARGLRRPARLGGHSSPSSQSP